MIDYGTRQTDLAVRRAEWRLSRVYHQAAKDIEDKMETWQKGHEAREAKYRQQVKDGKLSQEDFDAWMRGQVFQGEQWKARREQIDQILLNADKAAASIVNDGKLGVFAANANYVGYGLEHDANINTGFVLYDEQTVARLIKSDPQILPKPAPGVQKDKAYTYYNKLMNSAITQGIVQGETIPQIAKRIARTTGESSYKSAVRNARTAYTGAQNAGRIEGLHQAQSLGIKVQKKWMATLDSRTRDAHADLDGQVRDVDEPCEVDGMEIDFPGDPTADASLVYNCRCTLVYVYPEYPSEMQRRDNETGEIVGDMTYREWEESKRAEQEPEKEPESIDEKDNEDEGTLDWLFEQLMNEPDEPDSNEEEEPKKEELNRPGRYGISEDEYPKTMQLSKGEEERLEAIEHYFDDDYKPPKNMPRIRDDERQIANGHDEYYNPELLDSQRKQLNERIKTAQHEIEDKKAAGYKGKTREQSYKDWKKLQRELRGADEFEQGAILSQAAVGESGIQYWQRDRKEAERELQVIDFIEKLHRRYQYSRK